MPKPVRIDGLAVERRGRPRQPDARPEVLGIGIVIRRALRAEAAAADDIDHRGAIENLVRDRVVFVAQSQVQGQIRRDSEFVLRVALIERAPVADDALALQDTWRSRPRC